ncbi:MAG: hypothetical protein NC342_08535 [Pseudoflavonifractor sp.]|nr:hypothetical protein [Pseudoflavonifractor sp.]
MPEHIMNIEVEKFLDYVIHKAPKHNRKDRAKLLVEIRNIEKILPTYDSRNGLGDYIVHFKSNDVYTDIKTRVMYLDSNPKAYNVDKFLRQMADEKSVFMFFLLVLTKPELYQHDSVPSITSP